MWKEGPLTRRGNSFIKLQTGVQGLHVGKNTHGIRLGTHGQHVLYLNKAHTVSHFPVRRDGRGQTDTRRHFHRHHVTPSLSHHSLCHGESHFQIPLGVSWVQGLVFKISGEEWVDQRTESHSITPTRWEVLYVYMLFIGGRAEKTYYNIECPRVASAILSNA